MRVRVVVVEGRAFALAGRATVDALVAVDVVVLDRQNTLETLHHDETRVVPNTVSPRWNAAFELGVPDAVMDDAMVVFKAWDTRGIGRAFLGQVAIALTELVANDGGFESAEAVWYTLERPMDRFSSPGQLRIRVGLLPGGQDRPLSPSLDPGPGQVTADPVEADWELLQAFTHRDLVRSKTPPSAPMLAAAAVGGALYGQARSGSAGQLVGTTAASKGPSQNGSGRTTPNSSGWLLRPWDGPASVDTTAWPSSASTPALEGRASTTGATEGSPPFSLLDRLTQNAPRRAAPITSDSEASTSPTNSPKLPTKSTVVSNVVRLTPAAAPSPSPVSFAVPQSDMWTDVAPSDAISELAVLEASAVNRSDARPEPLSVEAPQPRRAGVAYGLAGPAAPVSTTATASGSVGPTSPTIGTTPSNRTPGPAYSPVFGVVVIELVRALNLGIDFDGFMVVTFGAETFRSKVVRQGRRGKEWHERLVLLVKEAERHLPVRMALYEYEKFRSDNTLVATVQLPVMALYHHVVPDEAETPIDAGPSYDLIHTWPADRDFQLRLAMEKQDGIDGAQLQLRGYFVPYQNLRRAFWLRMADQNGQGDPEHHVNRVELWAMLNSLDASPSDDVLTKALAAAFAGIETASDSDAVPMDRLLASVDLAPPGEESLLETTFQRLLHGDEGHSLIRSIIVGAPLDNAAGGEFDDFVVGGYLTETYARKGWFQRLLEHVSHGAYDVGRDNANVIVYDRATGHLLDEKMPTYIRLGIRAIYRSKFGTVRKGLDSRMVKAVLQNLTIRQGKKYDDPASVASIRPFVRFHKINTDEILDRLDSFRSFNEFFYRKLRPGARVLASADPAVAVSPADSRMLAFASIDDATRLWIKGQEFTLEALLDDAKLAQYYAGGSLAIFRLAPQDYHRFHAPVDGVVGRLRLVNGTYYTVNPMAIRDRDVNVFTENKRIVATIRSPEFHRVGYVIIGAMMVGSIHLSTQRQMSVQRMDELGYFAFGGSTIICVFKPGAIEFDRDLLENSSKQLETLVRVGNSIGRRATSRPL